MGATVLDFNILGWVFDDLKIQCHPRIFFPALAHHLMTILHNVKLQEKMIDDFVTYTKKSGKNNDKN